MAQTVPQQHPAVVLRSHYAHLRVFLVIALIALAAMTVAVVALATSTGNGTGSGTTSSPAAITAPASTGSTRYNGGPEEGSRGTVIPTANTMLIDRDGKIARIWEKVKVPGHAEEVLAAAKALP